jgi:hypothetical protein
MVVGFDCCLFEHELQVEMCRSSHSGTEAPEFAHCFDQLLLETEYHHSGHGLSRRKSWFGKQGVAVGRCWELGQKELAFEFLKIEIALAEPDEALEVALLRGYTDQCSSYHHQIHQSPAGQEEGDSLGLMHCTPPYLFDFAPRSPVLDLAASEPPIVSAADLLGIVGQHNSMPSAAFAGAAASIPVELDDEVRSQEPS